MRSVRIFMGLLTVSFSLLWWVVTVVLRGALHARGRKQALRWLKKGTALAGTETSEASLH